MSTKSWEYLRINHGCQVLWNLSTLPLSCAKVSSISQMSLTLFSHSGMKGTWGEFQCNGISDLATLRRCLVIKCLYLLKEKLATCSKQHATFRFNLFSAIFLIKFLTLFQKVAIKVQCHQMWVSVPVSN